MTKLDPQTIILSNGDAIEVALRRSLKARNVRIHITQQTKLVELVVPKRTNLIQAQRFLLSKERWIRQVMAKIPDYPVIKLEDQAIIDVLGQKRQIIHSDTAGRSYFSADKLIIQGLREYLPKKVQKLLSQLLQKVITEYVQIMCDKLHVNYNKITVKETNSRWGSCSSGGNLSFCWRLVFAPLEVVEYVVAHEVSHLCEMNHSDQFWRIVASLVPDYQKHKCWLADNRLVCD